MTMDTNGTQHGGLQRNPNGSELKLKPLLLGNGRLAKHLHHYFHLLNLPHQHFENARDLDSTELHRKLEGVNAIWILTSDRSIAPVKTALEAELANRNTQPANSGTQPSFDQYTWMHSSAATEVEGMITLHPLMTFGHELYAMEQYQQIPFAVMDHSIHTPSEAPLSVNPSGSDFDESFRHHPLQRYFDLPNPSFRINSDQRALYHAHAVLMSNLPILLWTMASKNAESKLNLVPETFDPILRQTLHNFISQRENALTGPIARGDRITIEKNLTALRTPLQESDHTDTDPMNSKSNQHSSPLADIYETFLSSFSYHSERKSP
jgi:hypothetical protein